MSKLILEGTRSHLLWTLLQRGFKRHFLTPKDLTAQTRNFRQKPHQDVPIVSVGFVGPDIQVAFDRQALPEDTVVVPQARIEKDLARLQAEGNIYRGQTLARGTLRIAGIEPAEGGCRLLLEPADPHDPFITTFFTEPRDVTRREELINTLVQKIESAQTRIWLAVFAFTNDRLQEALRRAKQRGVDVRVIMDPAQAMKSNAQTPALEQGGVKVLTGDLTMHHKFCLIDYQELFEGSFNWTSANVMNYEDYTSIRGKSAKAQRTIDAFEARFRNLWEMFHLGKGTIVPPGRISPLLETLGFYAFCYAKDVPLEEVKRDEIFLGRLTEYEFRKLAELHQRGGYTFHLSRYRRLEPLVAMIDPQFGFLRKLVLECLADLPPNYRNNYFFFGPASPSKRHHKAHANRLGGVLAHHQETASWASLLAPILGASAENQNEAVTAALLHDPFPPPEKKADKAKMTAGFLQGKSAQLREKLSTAQNQSAARVISAVRNHLHIWTGIPITEASPMPDKLLFLANHLASIPYIYLAQEVEKRGEGQILKDLLERPLTNPYKTYAHLIEGYAELEEADKQVLAVAYALAPAFILSPDEANLPHIEKHLLTEKAEALRTLLLESLELRRSGTCKPVFSAPHLANLICLSREVRVFTYDGVRQMLAGTEVKKRTWDLPTAAPEEFSRNLQELLLGEFGTAVIKNIEREFRRLVNQRLNKKHQIGPVYTSVILWMITKAQSLNPAVLYQMFWLQAPEQRERFQALLYRADQANLDNQTRDLLQETLRKARISGGEAKVMAVLADLDRNPVVAPVKSLSEINCVLQNAGVQQRDITAIMKELVAQEPQQTYRSMQQINAALNSYLRHRSKIEKERMIRSINRHLLGFDLQGIETIGQKVDRVLKKAEVEWSKRRGAVKNIQDALAKEATAINQEMEALFADFSLAPAGIIPEFEMAASALLRRQGNLSKEAMRTYLQDRYSLDWRQTTDPAILAAARQAKASIRAGRPIVVHSRPSLEGTLATAMVIKALREEAEKLFKERNPRKKRETIASYQARAQRESCKKIRYILTEEPLPDMLDPAKAFNLARAINPTPGLEHLDLETLRIFTKPGEISAADRPRVNWGLELLNNLGRNIGLSTLLEAKDLHPYRIEEGIIGFQIMPVLQAGCLKGQAERVVELLLADHKVAALAQLEVLMKLETEIATDPGHPKSSPSQDCTVKVDGQASLDLISRGSEALLRAVFGPFNPDNEKGTLEGRPVFVISGARYGRWLGVGKYDSHRSFLVRQNGVVRPAFWRRANTQGRWQETGKILLENDSQLIAVAASIGLFRGRRGGASANLEIEDIQGDEN